MKFSTRSTRDFAGGAARWMSRWKMVSLTTRISIVVTLEKHCIDSLMLFIDNRVTRLAFLAMEFRGLNPSSP